MKIVKLSNRHKAHKKWGFAVGIRFTEYGSDARQVCEYLENAYKTYSYQKPYWRWSNTKIEWYADFGNRPARSIHNMNDYRPRPYWIYLKNEADISMLILTGLLDENN